VNVRLVSSPPLLLPRALHTFSFFLIPTSSSFDPFHSSSFAIARLRFFFPLLSRLSNLTSGFNFVTCLTIGFRCFPALCRFALHPPGNEVVNFSPSQHVWHAQFSPWRSLFMKCFPICRLGGNFQAGSPFVVSSMLPPSPPFFRWNVFPLRAY